MNQWWPPYVDSQSQYAGTTITYRNYGDTMGGSHTL